MLSTLDMTGASQRFSPAKKVRLRKKKHTDVSCSCRAMLGRNVVQEVKHIVLSFALARTIWAPQKDESLDSPFVPVSHFELPGSRGISIGPNLVVLFRTKPHLGCMAAVRAAASAILIHYVSQLES
jgi:hypothetical protein